MLLSVMYSGKHAQLNANHLIRRSWSKRAPSANPK